MPKKEKKKEKKNVKKKRILKELANKLKENDENPFDEKKEQGEKIGKKDFEEKSDLNSLGFDSFSQSLQKEERKAPVLERIAEFQPRPIFAGEFSETPQKTPDEEKKKSEETRYVPKQEEKDELKYSGPSSEFLRGPERVDFLKVGRGQVREIPQIEQKAFFRSSEPLSQREGKESKRWEAEKINVEKAGRKDPFKREEIKYEKYQPKSSKSY